MQSITSLFILKMAGIMQAPADNVHSSSGKNDHESPKRSNMIRMLQLRTDSRHSRRHHNATISHCTTHTPCTHMPSLIADERLSGAVHDAAAAAREHTVRESATTDRGTLQPPLPPHTPQSSRTLRLLGTPSQPVQVELLPPHTPHASSLAVLEKE